jgi:hypothetical protein
VQGNEGENSRAAQSDPAPCVFLITYGSRRKPASGVELAYMFEVRQRDPQKAFYLETVGCQTNVHDSWVLCEEGDIDIHHNGV